MAISNNNIYSLQLLRNGAVYANKEAAYNALSGATALESVVKKDGVAVLARYIHEEGSTKQIRTLVGYYADASAMTEASGGTNYMTIVDTDGTAADIEELKQKIGTGVTTANTVTKQLQDLSGNTASTSADTSVEGAKKYANEKIAQAVNALDGTITADTGYYINKVDEVDGKISGTTAALPSVADSASAKTFVTSVSENLGEISVSKGTISSSGKTITLTDNADGGVNFDVNIDNDTIVKDASTGVLSVDNSALVEYVGDEETIHISDVDSNNKKTVSSLLTISATTSSETNVREQYNLVDASGNTKGAAIKIYKDSSLYNAYLGHVDDTITSASDPTVVPGTGDTALCFIYLKADGTYELVAVNVEEFIEENEFASGVTWDNTAKKVKGVVDSTSETFLTVGAGGFKLSGVQDAIDNAVSAATEGLDASVTGGTTSGTATSGHIQVVVDEVNGKLTAVTVSETNIADADDLAALSAKTVTEIASSNNSISATSTAATDGTVSVDLVTDASKIQMSGFTSTDVLSGITSSSSITEAFKEVDKVITENEETVSAALNDLEATKVENIEVNGVSGTVTDNVASVTIDGADIKLDGYTKASSTGAVAPTDTVNQAIGKLEKGIEQAVAGGLQQVNSGSGVTVSAVANNQQTINVKLADANNITGVAENAIKFNSTDSGLYIDSLDCGTY